MDRFYRLEPLAQSQGEIQLTGVTSLFIISKFFEVEPLILSQVVTDLCFEKYNPTDFIARETAIIARVGCEIDAPHVLEFALLYFRMIKLHVQSNHFSSPSAGNIKEIGRLILEAETFAMEFCKFILVDIDLMNVRPSILAATSVCFGLFVAHSNRQNFDSANARQVTLAWKEIALVLLPQSERDSCTFEDIEQFMKEICERSAFIQHKYGHKLQHLYKPDIIKHLPKITSKIEAQYVNII